MKTAHFADLKVKGQWDVFVSDLMPIENSISEKIGKVREPRRANHSGFRSMIASLAEKTGRGVTFSVVEDRADVHRQHLC